MRRRLSALLLLFVVFVVGCSSADQAPEVKMIDPPAELESRVAPSGRWILAQDGAKTLEADSQYPDRGLYLVEGDTETEIGRGVISAIFGPEGEIYFLTLQLELKRWRAGELEELLPAGSANGPLLVNEARTGHAPGTGDLWSAR